MTGHEFDGIDPVFSSGGLGKIQKSKEVAGASQTGLGEAEAVQNAEKFKKLFTHYQNQVPGMQAELDVQKVALNSDTSIGTFEQIQELQQTMQEIHKTIEADLKQLSELLS